MLINWTIPANPDTYKTSSKSTTTQEWGPWSNPSPWRPGTAYALGPRYCEKFKFSTPGIKTAITISLRLGVDSAYGAKLYLADNGDISPNNLETMALASATIADTREEQSFAFENISISGDYYIYTYAVSDTDSTAFYIPDGSTATTSYETNSKIEATCTLRGTSPNTEVPADVVADILPTVGTYNPFTFRSAVFHWRL